MKTSNTPTKYHRNNFGKLIVVLPITLFFAAATPSQAAGCACSSKPAKDETAAIKCCNKPPVNKSTNIGCGCGAKQENGGHTHLNRNNSVVQSAKITQNEQNSQRSDMPEYARKALLALQRSDIGAAETILRTQHQPKDSPASAAQLKLAIGLDLLKLAINLRDQGQQTTRKNTVDRGKALMDEAIGIMQGREKATTLLIKAQYLKRSKGDEVSIQKLVEEAHNIDPANPHLVRFANHNTPPSGS